MQRFLKWTLKTIRKDGSMMSWMEEKRFEWVPLASSMLQKLLAGQSIIVITDDDRDWFGEYILKTVNLGNKNRPLLPFVSIKTFFPNIHQLKNKEDIELLEDMLSQSFLNGYTFFYIGKSNDIKMQLAKRNDESFSWVLDEHLQNSFYLSSGDDLLDIKLIQLFRLLDKSIDAVLFAEVSLEDE
ncbi:HobA family DNA replication regulator [Sulfurospirillum arcachonense]|uniref:HobA family DNA replication regulator n=1 Tax=Sulfurospirillum arcachonense TaxID=57666 RepID=UPI0004680A9B|nr:HobA family DNA replication regulator [Sulfurospirillum arcachonense]